MTMSTNDAPLDTLQVVTAAGDYIDETFDDAPDAGSEPQEPAERPPVGRPFLRVVGSGPEPG